MKSIKNIINVELDGKILKNHVFKQIAEATNKQFIFVSAESKESLKKYIGSDKPDMKLAKNVWKDLLIDAMSLLKVNDSREKIYSDSRADQRKLIDNLSHIRKSNSYGIDEIDKYFDDFIEFESVLYGMDRHYRDHINHVLQVWAIGIGLIAHSDFQLNDGLKINKDVDFHFEIDDEKNKDKEITISKSELWAMWTVIALCHDLGYPIEKTSQINKQAKKIISHFGNMQFTELDYSFTIFNTFLVEKFLNIISSKITKDDTKAEMKDVDEAEVKPEAEKPYHTSIQTKYRDKLSKSLEDYKHGIFSSLLLFKNLTYFLETDYSIREKSLDEKDAKQFYIRKEILRSIAGHTCPKLYHIDFNTLSFLLILCDELQEWNRPKFDSFVNNYKEEELTVQIKEFDMGESQKNKPQKIHIVIEYKDIEVNDELEKYLVIYRYKNIHYLLRSANDDSKRKILFQWDINFKVAKFSFCFDTSSESKDSFNMLSVKKDVKDLDLYDPNYS